MSLKSIKIGSKVFSLEEVFFFSAKRTINGQSLAELNDRYPIVSLLVNNALTN